MNTTVATTGTATINTDPAAHLLTVEAVSSNTTHKKTAQRATNTANTRRQREALASRNTKPHNPIQANRVSGWRTTPLAEGSPSA
ncbi:Uncharacterised protein [Mycobacteroides abscessus subsp. massiliense]|nr:Uncharacterised protein [Mycobacteroides abscessus subsp. massiliense]SKU20128.1 Uncharacterised protein [Mycobacteroides abscessus subsp. massiliense]